MAEGQVHTANLAESKKWWAYFETNSQSARDIPWHETCKPTAKELAAITKSVQQFQLGEASNGKRLLKRAQAYALAAKDPLFVTALSLFVKEEQRHSLYLAQFMQLQGIPLLDRHWVDTVFRWLRGLAGLELSLTVLVTAELIAVPYYRALRDATGSRILRAISARILEDEAAHLLYQSSMLARLGSERSLFWKRFLRGLHRLFLLGTILVVWVEHRSVFGAGNYDFWRFKEETLHEFRELDISSRASVTRPEVQSTRLTNSGSLEGIDPADLDR